MCLVRWCEVEHSESYNYTADAAAIASAAAQQRILALMRDRIDQDGA